jgi:hypothetical protein
VRSGRCGLEMRGSQIGFWMGTGFLAAVATVALILGSGRKHAEAATPAQTVFSPAVASAVSKHDRDTSPRLQLAQAAFSSLPLIFEPNQGQTDAQVKFLARGSGYGLFLTEDQAVLVFNSSPRDHRRSASGAEVLRMELGDANRKPQVTGTELLAGKSHYLLGNDPTQWHRDVPQFARVRYGAVYPGIDLVYYGNQGRLEYDFEVAPGADPARIALRFQGQKHLELSRDGELVLSGLVGNVRLKSPRIYQRFGQEERGVKGHFVLRGGDEAGIAIGDYDRSRTLVIDPVLAYSTYLGGTGDEACSVISGTGTPIARCPAIAVDSASNIYIAGSSTSTNFPNPTGTSPMLAGTANVFVAKINPGAAGGAQLIYSTFVGGNGVDLPAGIAVDSGFDVIVAGRTTSSNFPASNGFQTAPQNAGQHAFLSKLNTGGVIVYSTYLSSAGTDAATGVALDSKGKAYVVGTTSGTVTGSNTTADFPTTPGSFQTIRAGTNQFFWSKIDFAQTGAGSLAYSTYFGGGNPSTGVATGGGIAVDPSGNVFFTGGTNFFHLGNANDFPIQNAAQGCLDAPTNPATCPTTDANNVPLTNRDAFVAKFAPVTNASNAFTLSYSTYLGGTGDDIGYGIATDSSGDAFVTGATGSTDFRSTGTSGAFQPAYGGGATDAFLVKLNPFTPSGTTGNVMLGYFTYLGGSGGDVGLGVALVSTTDARITGYTNSPNFPQQLNTSVQSGFGGVQDAFVTRIDTSASTTTGDFSSYLGGSGSDAGTGVAADVQGNTFLAGETASANFPTASPFQGALAGASDAFVSRLGPTVSLTVAESATSPIGVGNPVTFSYQITNSGDLVSGVTFSDVIPITQLTSTSGVSATASPGSCSPVSAAGVLTCALGTINSGSANTASVFVQLTPAVGGPLSDAGKISVLGSSQVFTPAPPPAVATVTDFSVAVVPAQASQTVQAGVPATYPILVTPLGSGFPNSVNITVSGLPPSGTDTIDNNPIQDLSNGPQTRNLVVSTVARTTTTTRLWRRGGPLYAALLPLGGLAFLGFGGRDRRSRMRRFLAAMLLAGGLTLVLSQSGCGSSGSTTTTTGTPAGTYHMLVTATSGTASHTTSITLVVQ